ncbi:hypothetical protein LCGC14_0422150 [marine sediment metagenome]|uniref:Methyltransferase FkbM domain-containing protein n=1 Tax=marine sediment metagenome TaxID=412755 RepID=A0A0F9SQL1_9ZZZZ
MDWYKKARAYARRLRYSSRIEDGLCGLANIDFKTVLDIGAADGRSAKKYLGIFPNATIHSFEPQIKEYNKLRLLEEKEPRLVAHNLALVQNDNLSIGTLLRYKNQSTSTASILQPTAVLGDSARTPKVRETVNLMTLDHWANNFSLQGPILVKMDVQGYEMSVILGGQDLLRRAKAVITEVCFEEYYEGQANFWQLYYSLGFPELGFDYIGNLDQVAASDGKIKFIDACFLRQ